MTTLAALFAGMFAMQAAAAVRVEDLAWMSGRWEAGDAGRWTEEYWSAPRGGVMLGYSRSGRAEGGVREWEFIRLQAGADGVPVYWGSPSGRPPVGFALVASEGTSATFENPAHDYPQRIRYELRGDVMVATISAIDGSNARSWSYRRQ